MVVMQSDSGLNSNKHLLWFLDYSEWQPTVSQGISHRFSHRKAAHAVNTYCSNTENKILYSPHTKLHIKDTEIFCAVFPPLLCGLGKFCLWWRGHRHHLQQSRRVWKHICSNLLTPHGLDCSLSWSGALLMKTAIAFRLLHGISIL